AAIVIPRWSLRTPTVIAPPSWRGQIQPRSHSSRSGPPEKYGLQLRKITVRIPSSPIPTTQSPSRGRRRPQASTMMPRTSEPRSVARTTNGVICEAAVIVSPTSVFQRAQLVHSRATFEIEETDCERITHDEVCDPAQSDEE